ncbi:uncharacterized protein AMSG_03326 [Thecamonas trahens ATCC 50062]|uniref:START domain-containing protein n=1 Tax=Thecamonas trahens ATCC 50062 TaxID=461836 RepID=A0A0L0D3T1_THETB|nr:hypothetical protein AMSG_03326 [Thecamonas trahens ATCC 50062]KNC46895.1 hypothetical protein AMSG_03326 [Thecamonas trahens ATCC 50062]|eukprot:XP_013760168.1 hypothetical protein AMSG_03326 [Thecamonas trahens ATCC 50062]
MAAVRKVATLDELYASEESTGSDAPLEGLTITDTNYEWVADALLDDLSQVAAAEGPPWESIKTKNGCSVTQDKSGELAITRGKFIFRRSARIMFQVFRSNLHLKACDSRFKSAELLETFSPTCSISQMLYKFPMPLKDRAMVTFDTERMACADNDWEYIVCSSSAAHPAPLPRKHVRLFLQRSGYVIVPLNADGSRVTSAAEEAASSACLVTWIAQVDPRGKVPKKVSNMQSSAAFILLDVRDWMNRDPKVVAHYQGLAAEASYPDG